MQDDERFLVGCERRQMCGLPELGLGLYAAVPCLTHSSPPSVSSSSLLFRVCPRTRHTFHQLKGMFFSFALLNGALVVGECVKRVERERERE
jgi:hypothetical protein